MMKYTKPELEIIRVENEDIITTSQGTETSPKDENAGVWDLEIG